MFRFALPMLLSTGLLVSAGLQAAVASVDIETAATIYQDAAMREQVRASLAWMPAQIREMLSADSAAKLTDKAAERGHPPPPSAAFASTFSKPALNALAANLDADTVKKAGAFLVTISGAAWWLRDVATATLDEPTIDTRS
jgi:hypothetical protein